MTTTHRSEAWREFATRQDHEIRYLEAAEQCSHWSQKSHDLARAGRIEDAELARKLGFTYRARMREFESER